MQRLISFHKLSKSQCETSERTQETKFMNDKASVCFEEEILMISIHSR